MSAGSGIRSDTSRRPGWAEAVRWFALALAFSPVLTELAGQLAYDPSARFSLLAPLCLAPGFGAERDRRAPVTGLVAVAAGLALEVVAAAGQSWSLGRVGMAIAAIGLAAHHGLPPLRFAVLALMAVPVPVSVLSATSPGLETTLAEVACVSLTGAGLDAAARGGLLHVEGATVALRAGDGGLPLAVAAAATGWLHGVCRRTSPAGWIVRAAGGALLALPLQICLLSLGGMVVAASEDPTDARLVLDWGGLVLASVAIAAVWLRTPGGSPRTHGSDAG